MWLPKSPGFFINNRLSSMVCVILRSQPSSSLRQCRSSYMMKLQGLNATAPSLFGGRRPTFGFDVLPFIGVVFFPNPSLWELCCSLVLPIDGNGPRNIFGGGGALRGNIFESCFLYYSFPPLFSPSLSFSLSLSYGFFLDWVLADRNLLRCRGRLM